MDIGQTPEIDEPDLRSKAGEVKGRQQPAGLEVFPPGFVGKSFAVVQFTP
jgi:hypothetical protein